MHTSISHKFHDSLFKWSEVYTQSLATELRKAFSSNFLVEQNAELISGGDEAVFTLSNGTKRESNLTTVTILPTNRVSFDVSHELLNNTHELLNIVYLESPIYFKLRNVLKEAQLRNLGLLRRGALNQVPSYFYDLDNMLNFNLDTPLSDDLRLVVEKLEQVINGKLAITHRGDIVYEESGKEAVSLNMASSGISNLGLLALLLRRNILKQGSFLFIDEPEINLHTTWQHKMLEVLVDLSKAGVNVVIATHSLDMMHRLEYIVSRESSEQAEQHFSVNRLDGSGRTEKSTGSVLTDIYEAKQVLGEPYIDLMRERLP